MRMRTKLLAAACVILAAAAVAVSHFQVVKPSTDSVTADGPRSVGFEILFTHPMERGPVMDMGAPRAFGVLAGGGKTDLLGTLRPGQTDGRTTYTSTFEIRRPGDHVFYLEPAPYWEPSERKMIVHYTKVVVDGLGSGRGWDAMVGFPVEIEPLVRPYGLWSGNLFRGIVRRDGRPVPFAEIEVEYLNERGEVHPPSDAFVTQVIKADAHGVFAYAMPRAGWWAFAALVDGEPSVDPEGRTVDTELGGLIWVRTADMD
ncbi:MAG: DUF4198 domain-containing protein [Planctomycetes bacterium]|nr:DUF4198 domain-containing protein [Planctomycetota bacterium]